MDDSPFVRGLEPFGNLLRDGNRLVLADGATLQPLGEIFAVNQLHDQRRWLVDHPVDLRDVGMIQRGERLCLTLEAPETVGIRGK